MLIELHGADFQNKGGQLMLETAIQRVVARFPDATFCLEVEPRHPPMELGRLGLKAIYFPAPRRSPRRHAVLLPISRWAGILTPAFLLRRGNKVPRHSVDALLDVSGYAFGDIWGPGIPTAFARRARHYTRRRKPVIMLPQMFGPFESASLQNAMRDICASVNLVYARDPISYECVRNLLSGDFSKLRLAPDITIFAEPDSDSRIPEERYVCVVPNTRILDQGPSDWRDHYIRDLVRAIRLLRKHGLNVVLVVHETVGGDRRLAIQLASEAGLHQDCIYESMSPLQLKAVLGGAFLTVASRFHAAIGALSSGVPTIVLGWAHKYEMMMQDFNVADYVYRADGTWNRLESMILALLRKETHDDVAARLRQRKQEMRAANDEMWNAIFALLQNAA